MVKSLSIPADEMEKSEWRALKARAIAALQEAIASKGKRPEDYDYIDLRPTDIGFSNDYFTHTYSSANAFEEITSQTLGDDTFIVIYALYNSSPSPLTTKVRFWKGSVPIKEYYLQDMYIEDTPKKALDEPLVWAESDVLKIEGYAKATGTDELGFKGIIALPKGRVLGQK